MKTIASKDRPLSGGARALAEFWMERLGCIAWLAAKGKLAAGVKTGYNDG